MKPEDRFDLVIYGEIEAHFPALLRDLGPFGWLWIKAQVWQESRMNPDAVSPVGAAGLLQLMPATDLEIDGDLDGSDVVGNIDNGVKYLSFLYGRFGEIPTFEERLKFALASYNGGRGYINKALDLARSASGLPGSYSEWVRDGRPAGEWQLWKIARWALVRPECQVKGKNPDWVQIFDYVEAIENRFRYYTKGKELNK